jgi:acyl transferase domain-containing protein
MQLMQQGWEAMTEPYRRGNYLWLQLAQKGAVDKLIQLRVQDQQHRQSQVLQRLATALETQPASRQALIESMQWATEWLSEPFGSEETDRLEAQAHRWGEASDQLFGVRNEGLFNLDQDFVGLGWLRRELQRGLTLDDERLWQHIQQIVGYEDPGDGGFYDDAGDPERSPHLVVGWPFGDGMFSGSNRPSQRRMAFTTDQEPGVTFEYHDLDPQARYRVRMSLMRPRYRERFANWQTQTSQSIYADQFLLAERLELPEYEAEFFEFDIPAEATADGHLRLWFQKQPDIPKGPPSQVTVWRNTGGWGTLVSEVWLMRRP